MAKDGNVVQSLLVESGVYYGWFVVFVCFLLSLMTFGLIYSFSVFIGHILAAFGESHATTSVVFGLQSIVTFGGAAILGIIIDQYGARRLLALAAVLVVGGLLGASQLQSFAGVTVAYGLIAAAGLAITFVVSFATAPSWFERRRGLATGIATAGGGVGILAMPPLATFLIDRFGWQNAYLSLALLFLGVLVVAVLVIRDRPGELDIDADAEFADGIPDPDVRDWREQVREIGEVVKTRTFGFIILGYLLAYVPTYVLLVYLVEFTTNVGVARSVGVLAVSVIGGLNIVGKFVAGPIADRVGTARTFAACAGLMGITTVLLAMFHVRPSILVLAFLFGLGYGGIGALLSPLIADFFGTVDLNALFGISSVGFAITGSTVPYLVGLGFDLTGTYVPSFVAGGVLGMLGGVLLLVAAREQARS